MLDMIEVSCNHHLLRVRVGVFDTPGIVNGVDIDDWDPATDEHIEAHYWPGNMGGKKECKVGVKPQFLGVGTQKPTNKPSNFRPM